MSARTMSGQAMSGRAVTRRTMNSRDRSAAPPLPRAARFLAVARGAMWVGVVFVALPFALLTIADRRFGGRAPWSGLDQLDVGLGGGPLAGVLDGSSISIRDSLMAEVIVRLVVTVGWVAVATVALTSLREVSRGVSESFAKETFASSGPRRVVGAPARAIAMGVLALLPAPASVLAARPTFEREPVGAVTRDVADSVDRDDSALWSRVGSDDVGGLSHVRDVSHVSGGGRGDTERCARDQRAAAGANEGTNAGANVDPRPETHVVRVGESIYSIASDLVGRAAEPVGGAPTSGDLVRVAGLLLDLNLGHTMNDDDVFTSPAHIEPGWVLHLPDRDAIRVMDPVTGSTSSGSTLPDRAPAGSASMASVVPREVTVVAGDTLSGLVAEHLGPEADWREVYDWNAGREMGDGRVFDDPGLIIPGWVLDLEAPEPDSAVSTSTEVASRDMDDRVVDDRVVTEPVVTEPVVAAPVIDVPVVDTAEVNEFSPSISEPGVSEPAVSASERGGQEQTANSSILRWLGAALVGAGLLGGLRARRRRRLRALPSRPLPERLSQQDIAPSAPGPARDLERGLIAGASRDVAPSLDAAVRSLVDMFLRNSDVDAPGSRPICSGVGVIEFSEGASCASAARVRVELLDAGRDGRLDQSAFAQEHEWEVDSLGRLRSLGVPEPVIGVFPMPLLVELGRIESGNSAESARRVLVDLESVDTLLVEDMDMGCAVIASLLASPYADGIPMSLSIAGDREHLGSSEAAALSALADAVGREFALNDGSHDGSSDESMGVGTGASRSVLGRWHDRLVLGDSVEGQVSIRLEDRSGDPRFALAMTGRATTGVVADLDRDGRLRFVRRPVEPGADRVPDQLPDQFSDHLPEPVLIDAHRLTPAEVMDIARGLGGLPEVLDEVLDDAPDDAPDEAPEVEYTSELDPRDALNEPDEPAVAPEPSSHLDPTFIVRLFGDVRVEARGDAHVDTHVDGQPLTGSQISDVAFEKSKSVELLAWMVTHRERSTRAKARSAMWEGRVAASTFANVVSDARRSLARAVAAENGDWIERTMTEELRLASGLVSDAELMSEVRDLIAGRGSGSDPDGQDSRGQVPDDQHVEARLRDVLGLIRGMPFEGTAYLWPDPEGITSELVMLATGLAMELAERCLARSDLDGVVWATGQGLRVLRGHEGLIALRLRARASIGDLAGVRQEWASYERVLADDWGGGEPAPELVELRRELLTR